MERSTIQQLRGYNLVGEYDKLFKGYSQILSQNTIKVSAKLFDPLLYACDALRDYELSKEVINHMRSRNIVPTESGCALYIKSLSESGDVHTALQFYREIKKDMAFKTDQVFLALMKGLQMKQDLISASQVFNDLLQAKIPVRSADFWHPLLKVQSIESFYLLLLVSWSSCPIRRISKIV